MPPRLIHVICLPGSLLTRIHGLPSISVITAIYHSRFADQGFHASRAYHTMLVHYDYYYDLLDHGPTPSYFWYRRGLGVMRHAKMKNERKHYTCAARASDDNNGT